MDPALPRPRRFSWALAFTLVVLIFAALAALVFLRLESWPIRTAQQGTAEMERLAHTVRDAFFDIAHLQPRVTIKNRVYLEQTNTVAELALVSRQIEVEHEFSHTWAGSTKRVKLHGTYAVKAGFDLRRDLSVDVQEKEIAIRMTPAVILGVEQSKLDVLDFENGFWNRISAEDLQSEIAELPKLARQKALDANLPREAESSLQDQLQRRLGDSRPLHLFFTADAAPKQ